MQKNVKILAIASEGGHWIQLRRLEPIFINHNTIFVKAGCNNAQEVNNEYRIKDINAQSITIPIFFSYMIRAAKIIRKENPTVLISTGALPGLFFVIVGRLFLKKTIWIDSIANSDELSASGKAAKYLAHLCLTQWEHLADNKNVKYIGSVL